MARRLRTSPHPEEAQRFLDFVRNPAGRRILDKDTARPIRRFPEAGNMHICGLVEIEQVALLSQTTA